MGTPAPFWGGGGLAMEIDSTETSQTSQTSEQRRQGRDEGQPGLAAFHLRGLLGGGGKVSPVGPLFEAQPEVPVDR